MIIGEADLSAVNTSDYPNELKPYTRTLLNFNIVYKILLTIQSHRHNNHKRRKIKRNFP